MVASLQGIIFDQVYGDNSGGAEFDSDGDGTATQEDEFVSFANTTGSDVDISGWQIWSDSIGVNAPDAPQDGLYHTFPPGTVLKAGQTLYIINEISGTEKGWQQEASEGGVESGAGGDSTNFLSEGSSNDGTTDSIALVNPATGDFLVFNMSNEPEAVSSEPGFPGTTKVGEIDANAVQQDQDAGSSYRYNSGTDSYDYSATYVPCFVAGTLIDTPGEPRPVEDLRPGDAVLTLDHGAVRLRGIQMRELDFRTGREERHKPIAFKPGSLGSGLPACELRVSPQHRIFIAGLGDDGAFVPAKALLDRAGVRQMRGCRRVTYIHLSFDRHEIVFSNGAPTESFLPGSYIMHHAPMRVRRGIERSFHTGRGPRPARPCITVSDAREMLSALG